MLAVPGALIALGLAYLAALGTVERDRRDLALLRARGARRRDLLVLAASESLILGLVAGLLGTAAAFGAVSALVTGGTHATHRAGAGDRRDLRAAGHRRGRRGTRRRQPLLAADERRHRPAGDATRGQARSGSACTSTSPASRSAG